ncbi:aminotransferase class I/II-fold pyridoxal phosphate-dependent enzyme [Paenibacillus sp. WQ 127069]|uniref:Aminotransferase class I/II-fold pyridoxal phosphate-dependent enzyme n=1 Tax=Paenibacillus baimaensis TaxID=2982185 RepID=A0ABT2UVX8_9BACL|nr:aminotransferase class I/II-fold pyridoxal phosphate-dependent enzyme [Paenibacillus sp. WQ 127069]MCU6798191.1 aminotransferase class I/II-fold pyridoxal phosphate-dependent enzyme [Paenibacillus sp. WQ 127069]
MNSHKNPLPYTLVAHDKHDERHHGAVTIPIYQNTLFSFAKSDEPGHAFKYSRMGNPTVQELEKRLAALEYGEKAQCFASGMAAISAAILSTVRTGDHIICVDQVYFGTREFFEFFLTRYGVEVTYVDGTSIQQISEAIRDNTTLIYLESPTSYYFQLQDLTACVQAAKTRHIKTIIDNTWASPCYQNPLRLGIDLVVHSLTKYVGGHSDVLGGAVVGSAELLDKLSRVDHQLLGGVMTPHTASLLLRGMRTLPLRMERLSKSALTMAEYFSKIPCIHKVNFPGLPAHPQHKLAVSQMSGWGSLMSIEVKGTLEQAKAWVDQLQYFRIGLSFGGYESLVLVVGLVANAVKDHPVTLIRFNIGLEDPVDLMEDISTIHTFFSLKQKPAVSG